jgi:hypothetical protein
MTDADPENAVPAVRPALSREERLKRDDEIRRLHDAEGLGLAELGRRFDLTRQRVLQILRLKPAATHQEKSVPCADPRGCYHHRRGLPPCRGIEVGDCGVRAILSDREAWERLRRARPDVVADIEHAIASTRRAAP